MDSEIQNIRLALIITALLLAPGTIVSIYLLVQAWLKGEVQQVLRTAFRDVRHE